MIAVLLLREAQPNELPQQERDFNRLHNWSPKGTTMSTTLQLIKELRETLKKSIEQNERQIELMSSGRLTTHLNGKDTTAESIAEYRRINAGHEQVLQKTDKQI